MPGEQAMHSDRPGYAEYVPGKHSVHVDSTAAPVVAEYLPIEH